MSRAGANTGGWTAFNQKQRQKQGLEPKVDKDLFPPISNTISSLHPCENAPRTNDFADRPFSFVLNPHADSPTLAEDKGGKRPLLDEKSIGKHNTSIEDHRSSMKKIIDLHSWADVSLVEDIMAGVSDDITKASKLLAAMISPSCAEESSETIVPKMNSSLDVSFNDRTRHESYSLESGSEIVNLSSTPEICLEENNLKLLSAHGSCGNIIGNDAAKMKLVLGSLESVPVEMKLVLGSLESVPVELEWEEDDVYLRHRKDALRMMRLASQHSKAATKAFVRDDHLSAQQYSNKAREEWLAAESLNNKAAKEILSIRNSKNDVWKLDLHGLHASEATQVLNEHLRRIEAKVLSSVSPNRVNTEKGILRSSSLESTSCTETQKLDKKKATSTQRPPTSLQVITGIGNHSREQAALPAAVRSFLSENGYRFEELRPGVLSVRPKFRHR